MAFVRWEKKKCQQTLNKTLEFVSTQKIIRVKLLYLSIQEKIIQCKSNDHLGGSIQCPTRKVLEKMHLMTMRKLRKRTFAEMLKELDPAGNVHENPVEATTSQVSFPTRKEKVASKQAKKSQQVIAQRPTKPSKATSPANKYPPGFKKPETRNQQSSSFSSSCIESIKTLLNDLHVPPALQQCIINYATPYIDNFIKIFTDSFENQLNKMFGF